ncbi:hypothetical protein BSMD_019950 [Bacillus subtilis Miyagi-4]|nr:hypothetical protein BSMD_019950 [Bacillus subtilis Miyagi-4]
MLNAFRQHVGIVFIIDCLHDINSLRFVKLFSIFKRVPFGNDLNHFPDRLTFFHIHHRL